MTKLIISLKHLPYIERLKQLKLPTLKYIRLRGDMIDVFKIVKNYYDLEAIVKLNFNTFSTTLCLKKNDNDVLCYNFNTHQPILIIFGRDIAE